MNILARLFEDVTPRAMLGLAGLFVIVLYLIIDTGGRIVGELEIENRILKSKLADLRDLETVDGLESRITEAESLWESYNSLLLQDETEGLNIASLQSQIIAALSACGLENVVANIDAGPVDGAPEWYAYNVSVRARDIKNNFVYCLEDLALLDIGLNISDISWRPLGGNLQFELTAYGASAPITASAEGL